MRIIVIASAIIPSISIESAITFVIFTDFLILYFCIITSAGIGKSKKSIPKITSGIDTIYAPTSLKKENTKIPTPIDITHIPLNTPMILEILSLVS